MSCFRRHLRTWAAAWLTCQVLGMSALVPRHCCAAHEPPSHVKAEAEDPVCPMHAAAEAARPDPVCELRSTCVAPRNCVRSGDGRRSHH